MSSCLNSRIERFRMASHPDLGMSVSVRGTEPDRAVDGAAVSFLPSGPAGRDIIVSVRMARQEPASCPRTQWPCTRSLPLPLAGLVDSGAMAALLMSRYGPSAYPPLPLQTGVLKTSRYTREPLGRACPDYLVGGADPEVLEKVCLLPSPGDELVQAPWAEPRVRARQGPQGAPACGLSFHAEPQHLQFFQVAEGRPGEEAAVELQPAGLLPDPGGAHLVAADLDAEGRHDVQQGGTVLPDLSRDAPERAAVLPVAVGSRRPVRQLGTCRRPREMVIEVNAEHADL